MPIANDPTKKKKLSDLEETFKQIQESAGTLFGRVSKEGVTGAGGETLIKPTETPKLPGLGEEVKNRALGGVGGEGEPETPEDRLTTALTDYTTASTLREEKERLEKEKGVAGMKETVGSFEDEVTKTQTLLDQLEDDITTRTREYLVSEPQRRRVLAAEQEPLMKQLGIAERGLTGATGRLERTETDILTELGLIEKEKTTPLDLLEREVNIRTKIKDLATKDIPNVATSQFNDEGDLTIVTQDPTTGAFNTQTIKGIGKKAGEYEQFSSSTNDAGDVTIIGIKRDGTAEQLGVFKGIGGAKGKITEEEEIEQKLSASKGTDGYVDPNVYLSLRKTSEIGPDEFDKRYGSMLSPQEGAKIGIEGAGQGIPLQEKLENFRKKVVIYKDAGYSKKDVENVTKDENDLDRDDELSSPVQKIINEVFK